jgi:hypothetical protein
VHEDDIPGGLGQVFKPADMISGDPTNAVSRLVRWKRGDLLSAIGQIYRKQV